METILKNLLTQKISVTDITQWIDTNKSGLEELNLVDNGDFIPFFINYAKENCSWLLNKSDKHSDTGNTNKTPVKKELSPKKAQLQPNKDNSCLENKDYSQPKSTEICSSLNSLRLSVAKENAPKHVQVLNFGCAPYQLKRRENKPFKENFQKAKFKSTTTLKQAPIAETTKSGTDFNSLDAFPPLGAKVEDPKAKRRITPTPVQVVGKSSSVFGKTPFTSLPSNKVQNDAFRNSAFQDVSLDLQKERDLLKLARDKLVKQPSAPVQKLDAKSGESNIIKLAPQPVACILPDPKEISMKSEISVFSEVYNYIITKALVPNITSELFFMFELVTAKTTLKTDAKDVLFGNIHNCVYFAVSVLSQQSQLLYMLDNTTLTSLCEISYLSHFSPQLVNYLQQSLVKQETVVSLPSLTRVPFQLDDDSRMNFSDDTSFINFKKQRDLFYELLREWQGQSLQCADVKYHEKFLRKAKVLISLGPGTLNMYHLARLFQSQLVASCMCFEVNEVYDEVVSDIQKNFPDKFKKLQERFLTPTRVGGLTPLPSFYGVQSFFSELISAAGSPSFNQHLIDIFVSKILELNETDIFTENELSSFGSTKDKYVFLLHTLRLLGKFVGYVHFLPYSTAQMIPPKVAEFHIEARKRAMPPLELPSLLKKAAHNNQLILTVPWVVEYLSMMDSLALHLDHVQETLSILLDINKWNFPSKDFNSFLFFRLIIGWLFDVLRYPTKYSLLLQPITFWYPKEISQKGIDSMALINKQLIHSCCPYLIEFKVLVFNYLNNVKNKREVRKITPFSTTQNSLSSVSSKQQIESELEENFFALHPQSVKKTCDFVAERMASKAISKIRSEVTKLKLKVVDDTINSEAYKCVKMAEKRSAGEKLQDIAKLLDASVLGLYDDIRYKVQKIVDTSQDDIKRIIPIFLSEDTKQSVIDVCQKISIRIATNKITDWCESNLLIDTIKLDIKSKVKNLFNSEPDISTEKYLNVSQVLSSCRSTVVKIHSESKIFDCESLLNLVSQLSELIVDETSKLVKRTIIFLSIDLFIAVIVHNPDYCYDKFVDSLLMMWSSCPTKLVDEKMFLCPQNMTFLLLSNNFELTCEKLVYVVKYLLKNNLFSVPELQTCLNDIKELNWQDATLERTLEKFTDILST